MFFFRGLVAIISHPNRIFRSIDPRKSIWSKSFPRANRKICQNGRKTHSDATTCLSIKDEKLKSILDEGFNLCYSYSVYWADGAADLGKKRTKVVVVHFDKNSAGYYPG